MDPAIEYLRSRRGFTDAASMTTYRVYIHNREVEVAIRDYGDDVTRGRFSAEARLVDVPDGRELVMNTFGLSLGNPDDSVEAALDNVHWNVFEFEE
ncbi:hypothetical protein QF046_000421 [Microbacterium sp. W4I4]|uniref:hypothetical protein n=1 Tax=Microbacterium sp. W4I4 TaxID=3042295 RepID=UPI00278292B6|nr:hypothetical protein [Microbacterium sp. W4I4]MDQ0612780.1 hypothetical protein [Microbacterium sp. W4I4]